MFNLSGGIAERDEGGKWVCHMRMASAQGKQVCQTRRANCTHSLHRTIFSRQLPEPAYVGTKLDRSQPIPGSGYILAKKNDKN
jgi:hypothetical protein